MIETLIFDLDGTLADTAPDLTTAMNHSLTTLGKAKKPEGLLKSYIGEGLDNFLSRAFESDRSEILKQAKLIFKEYYSRNLINKTRLYPGVKSTLKNLKSCGLKFYVCSNKPIDFILPILRGLGINDLITESVGQYRFATIKPDPEGINYLLQKYETRSEQAMIIGDHFTDIETGLRAGIRSVFCSFGMGYLKQNKPDFTIKRFSALKGLIRKLNSDL